MQETNVKFEAESGTAGYYTWEVAEKGVSVLISYSVVDRLLSETFRGFGAVPKRGAEVGGILLGSAIRSKILAVRIDDFQPVPISYKSGPSYLLPPEDFEAFRNAVERWRAAGGQELSPVGYFRSHTREGLGLSADDLEVFDSLFPDPSAIALLVKPFVTKPCIAGIFFREAEGMRTESSYLEIPLKRQPAGAGPAPKRTREDVFVEDEPTEQPEPSEQNFEDTPAAAPERPVFTSFTQEPKKPSANFWIPLSFIFLVIGVLLGFQAGLVTVRGRTQSEPVENSFSLDLTAKKDGDAVNLKWNRQAPVLKKARGAMLTITDGLATNNVKIEPADLQAGSLFYKKTTDNVKFRFEVFTGERSSVVETLDVSSAGNTPGK